MTKTNGLYCCDKCNDKDMSELSFSDFSTWDGFGKLWEWAIRQLQWFGHFVEQSGSLGACLHVSLIDPDHFANAIYEYLKGRE
jgi:hypothetical protein